MYYEKPVDVEKRYEEIKDDVSLFAETMVLREVLELERNGYKVEFEYFDSGIELASDKCKTSTIVNINGHAIGFGFDLLEINTVLSVARNTITLVRNEDVSRIMGEVA